MSVITFTKSCLRYFRIAAIWVWAILFSFFSFAQGDARVGARLDARQITVGDQARLFIEAQNNPATTKLQWAVIPDTFNSLEVVERGKIDTIKQGDVTTYRQRLLITGFDSGVFKVPSFVFPVMTGNGTAYTLQTDSFSLVVQTVPVDTTQSFKPIKGIIYVKATWKDYLGLIAGVVVFIVLLVFVIIYFIKNRRERIGKPKGPAESLQDKALRMLGELEARHLWEKKQVKQYYVELTDIVRNYTELRYKIQVLELTTDELLAKTEAMPELYEYRDLLAEILHTADLAKFAKAEPLPQEHIDAMAKAKQYIAATRPAAVIVTAGADGEKQNEQQSTTTDK